MPVHKLPEFAAALPKSGRLLGFDVGETTIGLAVTDVSRMIASPLETLARGKWKADLAALQKVIAAQGIVGLVIGYPINMDGSEGPRCQSTRQFVKNLEPHTALPALMWDERMSTQAVERMMIEADMSRQRRDEIVDKLAAAYVLQGALDAMEGLNRR